MEKFTYWDNPLNRSNISHKSEVCDQFFFSGAIHGRFGRSVTDKPHRWRQVQVHRRVQETAPSAPEAFCAWLPCIRGQKGTPRGLTLAWLTLHTLPVIFSKSNTTLLVVKNPPADAGGAGDMGSIPGNGNPLQYSCQEKNPMDWRAWPATAHGVPTSRTRLTDWPHTHAGNKTKDHIFVLSSIWLLPLFSLIKGHQLW